ncbi:Hypothetical predicted protein [Olea europaea subsp. europaea]|uniref:Uncharacterized protein n=2 Tax=Olea europaea subsp. europaea TaxID=158383 RepID=A0A8S0P6Z2_OLEEU|nr:Hypothetical predicted protein [Olea europaea subsp. europaea]
MIPIENYGVKCVSMGSLVAESEALVWRGPMVTLFHGVLFRRKYIIRVSSLFLFDWKVLSYFWKDGHN